MSNIPEDVSLCAIIRGNDVVMPNHKTKILGDDEAGEDYIFNNLEDFSHLRCEIKYHF